MATDFLKPVVSDPYATLLPGVNQAIVDLGKGLDPATSGVHTNVPTNTVRWNSATARWQLFNATSWVDLSALYGINISGNAATATTATTAGACTGNAATATNASTLQTNLAASTGAGLVGSMQAGSGAVGQTVQDKLQEIPSRAGYDTDVNFNAAKVGKPSIDATGRFRAPLFIAGDQEISAQTLRDAVVVARSVVSLTDCHAFADRTIMSGVTDAGTYGAFDSTTTLQGVNAQNHMYAFQDRNTYAGSGSITTLGGFMSVPVHSGTGVVSTRNALEIRDVTKTSTGTVGQNIGVNILDLLAGGNNAAIAIAQTTGNTLYASGGAPMYHKGAVIVGGQSSAADGVSLVVSHPSAAVLPKAFMHAETAAAMIGVLGNYALRTYMNGGLRLEVTDSVGAYAVRPGADNAQPLGDATKRWSVVYSGTAAINTSDERAKRQIGQIDAAVLRAWAKVEFVQYKFNDAVTTKGDGARWHFGVIAQRVKEAFESEGLDAFAYGVLCYDEWGATDTTAAGNRYGIRYEEALALECAYLRSRLK